ncbi:Pathogeneis-related protein 1C [Fusarium oxysporum f. sp. albedinis]|jgi:hypothetical protein|nr:Pathogeneis-related protein 1C [Fusarium oxysporum f. sp. albedinis]
MHSGDLPAATVPNAPPPHHTVPPTEAPSWSAIIKEFGSPISQRPSTPPGILRDTVPTPHAYVAEIAPLSLLPVALTVVQRNPTAFHNSTR